MSNQIKQIAVRIKELREIYSISLETLAEELGIPKGRYEAYESGEVDIPVSFLYKIAGRFNVELTAILTGDNPKLQTYSLVRKGKGVSVERRKAYKYHSLAYNFLNKKIEPFLVTVEPDSDNSDNSGNSDNNGDAGYNSHPGQEFNYVLEGEMQITIDGHTLILKEGDSLFFDSGIKHGMKALGGRPAKFLAIITQ
ncbi:MAG TPA: XRE family transcriptional regulator [Clostridiales bacterium]|nr:XRE family transcriptional regulator [Clostridiales bacterium]